MRSEKSIKNIKINLVFFFLSSLFVFLSRGIFVRKLGSEITGVNSLFSSVIGFLNLAELGFVNVIIYSLYDPLYRKDREKVIEILNLYKIIYRIIGVVILILGMIVSFRLDLLAKFHMDRNYIQRCFLLYLGNIFLSYIFSYRYAIAVADQSSYIITRVDGIIKVLKSIVQILSLVFFKSYYLWLIQEIFFSLIGYIITNKAVIKRYSWIEKRCQLRIFELFTRNKNIIANTGNMFFHQIGSFVVFQTDSILLARYVSLKYVAIYTNYYMVFSLASNIVAQIFNGLGASIGNLINEKNEEKSFNLWKTLQTVNFYIIIILLVCIYLRVNDFIDIWVGKGYLLSRGSLLVFLANLYFLLIRGSIGKFKDGYGIFWDKYIPVIESLINLIVSWILVIKTGLIGVLIGTLASNIFVMLFWSPYIVFKVGFKKNPLIYHLKNLKLIVRSLIPIIFTIIINNKIESVLSVENIYNFIFLSIINFFSISFLYLIFLIGEEGMNDFFVRIKRKKSRIV